MDKIELEILALSSSQTQSGSFALVLGEVDGNRRLPIIIGIFEAQAIAIEIEKIKPNRPMTHDLFYSFLKVSTLEMKEVFITDLKEGIFYSKIIFKDGNKNVELDARPSDAIAIALRCNCPIYTVESVLSEAGIILTEEDVPENMPDPSSSKPETKHSKEKTKDYQKMTIKTLQELLQKALDEEDYEKAAEIRDELNNRGVE